MGIRQQTFEDYEGFVEKFKPKKTTDDCYTRHYIQQQRTGDHPQHQLHRAQARCHPHHHS